MSKHAATVRSQTGRIVLRRNGETAARHGETVGRHRARPARWTALVRSLRGALLRRPGRTQAARHQGAGREGARLESATYGAIESARLENAAYRGIENTRPWNAACSGIESARLRKAARREIRGVRLWKAVRSGIEGARLWKAVSGGNGGARLENVARAMGDAVRRSCAALRRTAAGASFRARELSIQWVVQSRMRVDAGMSTAEYAVGTIAACGFAALLWKVVTSGEVRAMLAALIQKALKLAA